MIDWVGGLADLRDRVIRTIGDPGMRLREDPVRMLRAVALAARLDFTIDPDTAEAIRALRGEIVRSSPARILDEFYKILRQGRSRETFQMLHELGLLAYLLPEADQAIAEGGERLLGSLGRLDEYRNAGSRHGRAAHERARHGHPARSPRRAAAAGGGAGARAAGPKSPRKAATKSRRTTWPRRSPRSAWSEEEDALPAAPTGTLVLPFARRDLDRLRLVLLAQRRLRETHEAARRAKQASPAGTTSRRRSAGWRSTGARTGASSPSTGAPSSPVRPRPPTRRPIPAARPMPGVTGARRRAAAAAAAAGGSTPTSSGVSMARLDEAAIKERLAGLAGWEREGEAIRKEYRFADFAEAMAFVTRTARQAEAMNHHPDILINYSRVTLTLTSHDASGLTERDFRLAAKIDA